MRGFSHGRMGRLAAMAMLVAAVPGPALAQGAAADPNGAAMGWTMAAGILLLLAALPGLMLFHAGAVRPRAALSVAIHVALAGALASLAWALAGYSLAFAPGSAWIGGLANLGLANLAGLRTGLTLSEPAFALFQTALALLAPALLAGAFAERVRLGWLMLFVPLWVLAVYAPVTRWLWSSWLADLGTRDFAGGLAIHGLAGISALVLAVLVGPREGDAPQRAAHSPLLRLAGAGLLWIGLLALAGGSALAADDDAAFALLNSHLAACAGALGWIALAALLGERPGARGLAAGAIAGLASAASAAGWLGGLGAIAVGFAGAVACCLAARLIAARGIDDPGRGIAIHGVGGVIGALLLVPFAAQALGGAGYADGASLASQFIAQLVGVATVLLWGGLGTLLLALLVSILVPMRVPAAAEQAGLDTAIHGEAAWTHD